MDQPDPGPEIFFLFSVQVGKDDYWGEDFDSNKNCKQEKKIIKLNNEVGDLNIYV